MIELNGIHFDPTKGVYLAGPIKDCTKKEVHGWRDRCVKKIKYKCINPAKRDFSLTCSNDPMNEIVIPDKREIMMSSILLANCWKESAGTSMEIIYAWMQYRYVISVVSPIGYPSAWVVAHSHKMVHHVDTAIDYINKLEP